MFEDVLGQLFNGCNQKMTFSHFIDVLLKKINLKIILICSNGFKEHLNHNSTNKFQCYDLNSHKLELFSIQLNIIHRICDEKIMIHQKGLICSF